MEEGEGKREERERKGGAYGIMFIVIIKGSLQSLRRWCLLGGDDDLQESLKIYSHYSIPC